MSEVTSGPAVPRQGGGAEALTDDLRRSGARPRPGTAADTVGGAVPGHVAAPPDAAAAADLLAAAADHGLTVAARGHGTKADWGGRLRGCDLLVDTGALTGIEHAAGDLVVRAGAGVALDDLGTVLAEADQRLTVDHVVPGSTVGGVVATGLSGPRRFLHGPVRDLIIGMSVVRADGVAAKSGGVVVKNVAGYDLAKLHTGAFGTLGLITSVTFRLHPVPPAVRIVRAATADPAAAGAWLRAVLHSQASPAAVELDWPAEGPLTLQVLLEGASGGIDSRTAEIASLLDRAHSDDAVPREWGSLPGDPGDTLVKVAVPISRVLGAAAALRSAGEAAAVPVGIRGSAGCGVLYAALPAGADPGDVARLLARARSEVADGSVTVVRAAPPIHDSGVDLWGEVPGLALMRAIKDRFDPGGRMSPGRLTDGI
ncbi:glycolate oxidase FAD binding subunit [Spinactinospora alkalitolerans]|uniref:Glycolate oxidase FAD binding subunit n=1 Tax=Spinactinospora alkalitolerans TaxID=687207 RepID=A0A852U594_9ACTN|nr:FAD-binding oxidoreductase [Spinactinospora alkalitolerans]NYE49100.1 glycolate oxidase FAD binding subunit [Spinactinospora alkalitolerans]